MRFTDGSRWWQYHGDSSYALGTSLCYRHDWWQGHHFSALQVGEDNHFVQGARQANQLLSADAGNLMYATIHEQNTSPRVLGNNWEEIAG